MIASCTPSRHTLVALRAGFRASDAHGPSLLNPTLAVPFRAQAQALALCGIRAKEYEEAMQTTRKVLNLTTGVTAAYVYHRCVQPL